LLRIPVAGARHYSEPCVVVGRKGLSGPIVRRFGMISATPRRLPRLSTPPGAVVWPAVLTKAYSTIHDGLGRLESIWIGNVGYRIAAVSIDIRISRRKSQRILADKPAGHRVKKAGPSLVPGAGRAASRVSGGVSRGLRRTRTAAAEPSRARARGDLGSVGFSPRGTHRRSGVG